MVKVILTAIRHFECPNEKVEENGLVTKSSILSEESLGWPNTQIQILKYIYTQIQFLPKSADILHERDHKVAGALTRMGAPAKKLYHHLKGIQGKF